MVFLQFMQVDIKVFYNFYMIKHQNYQIQDVSLWPNLYSLDQNKRKKEQEIRNIISNAKTQFYLKNPTFLDKSFSKYLDESRDIYYPAKTNEPSYCRAGLHYSIPDEVVGIGLKINQSKYTQSQWAILYHGTKPQHLIKILEQGLKPGLGQAHKGTLDPWGQKVPVGVYFSFWLNQCFGYTLPQNPIIFECFVKDVYVAPGLKGYTVSNNSQISRILIPIKKDRSNQNI